MTPALAYWVDQLDPFLIHFTRTFGIRYYGLSYAVGFLAAACLLHLYVRAGKSVLSSDRIADFMVAAVLGVVLGGRIGSYFLYDYWRSFRTDPFEILRVWDGGMSFHGGLVGVMLAMAWFARSQKIPLLHLFDLVGDDRAGRHPLRQDRQLHQRRALGETDQAVPWAVIFPRSMPAGTPIELIPRGIPPNSMRPASRASCSSRTCRCASGEVMPSERGPAGWPGNS